MEHLYKTTGKGEKDQKGVEFALCLSQSGHTTFMQGQTAPSVSNPPSHVPNCFQGSRGAKPGLCPRVDTFAFPSPLGS